jgi:hypothetical protein
LFPISCYTNPSYVSFLGFQSFHLGVTLGLCFYLHESLFWFTPITLTIMNTVTEQN